MNAFLPTFLRRAWPGVAALVAATHLAAADPAMDLIHRAVDDMMAVVYDAPPGAERLSVRVRPLLDKYFDAEYATRSAIGPGWRQFSPAQQQEAVRLFTDLMVRTYVDRFEPGPRPAIAWGKPLQPADQRREVPTTITYEGEQYSVTYKLRETAGGWRIYDIVGENVSMVGNYRAQFDELFKQGGVDAVMRALQNNALQAPEPKQS